jgi:hypothetical protein
MKKTDALLKNRHQLWVPKMDKIMRESSDPIFFAFGYGNISFSRNVFFF